MTTSTARLMAELGPDVLATAAALQDFDSTLRERDAIRGALVAVLQERRLTLTQQDFLRVVDELALRYHYSLNGHGRAEALAAELERADRRRPRHDAGKPTD